MLLAAGSKNSSRLHLSKSPLSAWHSPRPSKVPLNPILSISKVLFATTMSGIKYDQKLRTSGQTMFADLNQHSNCSKCGGRKRIKYVYQIRGAIVVFYIYVIRFLVAHLYEKEEGGKLEKMRVGRSKQSERVSTFLVRAQLVRSGTNHSFVLNLGYISIPVSEKFRNFPRKYSV